MLCFSFFGLGIGVGGSMPTDGTIFLENLPEEYHYLLTGLSVFFSLGAILTSSIALYIIPRHSCPEDEPLDKCNFAEQNQGWRYLMSTLAIITVIFFLCRLLFFRLHESPKYVSNVLRNCECQRALSTDASYRSVSSSPQGRIRRLLMCCNTSPITTVAPSTFSSRTSRMARRISPVFGWPPAHTSA
jgi:MFS family permease